MAGIKAGHRGENPASILYDPRIRTHKAKESNTVEEQAILTFLTEGPITVGHIDSDVLDATNVKDFGLEVQKVMQDHDNVHFLLDFEKVTYISSAALSELIHLYRISRSNNGDVRLCDVSKQIMTAFEITNLNKMFVIYDAAYDEALKEFTSSLE